MRTNPYQVIATLMHGEWTVTDIARHFGINQSSAHRQIKQMIRAGLLGETGEVRKRPEGGPATVVYHSLLRKR